MAVYTKINAKDIYLLSNNFNIGKVIKFQGIKQGIENTKSVNVGINNHIKIIAKEIKI
jgi:hypothetical protein